MHTFKQWLGLACLGLVLVLATGFNAPPQSPFRHVALDMQTRTANKGFFTNTQARIYYANSGKMVSYFNKPQNYVVLNNAKGEVSLYDPEKNTVAQQQSIMYSTETSQLYFFLQNQKQDLGLQKMGFTQKDLRFEKDLMIAQWLPPMGLQENLSYVELVHEQGKPIYLAYIQQNGAPAKKVYFYDYTKVAGLDFPQSITQIDYTDTQDSLVSKTTYANMRVNAPTDLEKLDFEIPANAKVNK